MRSKLDLFLFTELDCEFNFFLTLSIISLDDETYYNSSLDFSFLIPSPIICSNDDDQEDLLHHEIASLSQRKSIPTYFHIFFFCYEHSLMFIPFAHIN